MDWNTFWFGVFQSMVGSGLFLIVLFYLVKPKIRLSSEIAEQTVDSDPNAMFYRFKILNDSLFYKAYDIEVRLFHAIPIYSGDGQNVKLLEIPLRRNRTAFLQSAVKGQRETEKTHACQFRTDNNLRELLKEESSYLQLQVTARHGLSGLPGIFVQRYYSRRAIKKGSFARGSYLNVLEESD